jgi:predicted phosphate transport protein (TIGR00153 family)
MFEEYLSQCDTCVDAFHEAFTLYLKEGPSPDVSEQVQKVDHLESDCDSTRRRIESAMFEKALIPESRADILGLLDLLDKIPNRCESLCYDILIERLTVPEAHTESFRDLVAINHDCYKSLSEAIRLVFTDLKSIREHIAKVDRKESESDVLRRNLIRTVFCDEAIAPDQRILLRDLAGRLSGISDRCEDIGDQITLLAVKRLT